MHRYYYVGENLDDIEAVVRRVGEAGIHRTQTHVLSGDDAAVDRRPELLAVSSFLKQDVVGAGVRGALTGLIVAVIIAALSWLLGFTASTVGFIVTLFAVVVAFGFCTWEGGLYGIQTRNRKAAQFEESLAGGKHILIVDADSAQADTLGEIVAAYDSLASAGSERSQPKWIMVGRREIPKFLTETMP